MLPNRCFAHLLLATAVLLIPATGLCQKLSGLTVSPTQAAFGATVTGTATINKAAPTGGVVIQLSSNNPTAAKVPASVTVPSGTTSAKFTFTVGLVHSAEKVVISAKDPTNRTITATLTAEIPTVRLLKVAATPTTVYTPGNAVGTVTLAANAPAGGFVVNLKANQSTVSVPSSVTVAAGAKTATFTAKTSIIKTAESAQIDASDTNGFTAVATLALKPPAAHVSLVTVSPATVTATHSLQGTVDLAAAAPTGGLSVKLSSAQQFISFPQSVTIKAGARSAEFLIDTLPVSPAGLAEITAQDIYGYSATGKFTVEVPTVRLTGLTVSPNSVLGGTPVTATVTLSAKAPAGGFIITLTTAQTNVTLPKTATIPAGATSATFSIQTSTVTAPLVVIIKGADKESYGASGSFTVNPIVTSTTVSMTNAALFSPASVTVAAGTTIIWNNTSTVMSHTITSDVNGSGPLSSNVAPTQSFSWTVPANAKSGTKFYYHCAYHGDAGNGSSLGTGMAGVIIVK